MNGKARGRASKRSARNLAPITLMTKIFLTLHPHEDVCQFWVMFVPVVLAFCKVVHASRNQRVRVAGKDQGWGGEAVYVVTFHVYIDRRWQA